MVIMSNVHGVQHEDDAGYERGITLQPFLHQVAGRATLMCLNETTVCKPLNFREHFFYQSLPPDIQPFAPRFKGVINVNIEETPDGFVALTGYPFDMEHSIDDHSKLNNSTSVSKVNDDKQVDSSVAGCLEDTQIPHANCDRKVKLRRSGSVLVDEQCPEDTSGQTVLSANPWIFKVHKEGLKRHLHSKHKVVQKFILLENVVSQFKNPCVLDLKMGTRLHGDYDDAEKRRKHKLKCASTTTIQLGLRLSGMQVFEPATHNFHCLDKYYGRKLDRAGLKSTLRRFFHDGYRIRYKMLLAVLQRLRAIRERLERLRSYRFYSSSLLIMYDGASGEIEPNQTTSSAPPVVDETTRPSAFTPVDVTTKTPSRDSNLTNVELKQGRDDDVTQRSNSGDDIIHQSCWFDIRMIDFAKSTHKNMDNPVLHQGPDHGYIFGLTNLIQLLTEIAESSLCSVHVK